METPLNKWPRVRFRNVAQMFKELGDIPAERVRMRPLPGFATKADVIRIRNRTKRHCELVNGVLIDKPMGFPESVVTGQLVLFIGRQVKTEDLGVLAGPDGMIKLAPHLVRMPDLAFYPWRCFPNRRIPREDIPELVPDLAIEVLSPSNTRAEITRKIGEYFTAGVRLVWLVDQSGADRSGLRIAWAADPFDIRPSLRRRSRVPRLRAAVERAFSGLYSTLMSIPSARRLARERPLYSPVRLAGFP